MQSCQAFLGGGALEHPLFELRGVAPDLSDHEAEAADSENAHRRQKDERIFQAGLRLGGDAVEALHDLLHPANFADFPVLLRAFRMTVVAVATARLPLDRGYTGEHRARP